jgi:hypothetical protein
MTTIELEVTDDVISDYGKDKIKEEFQNYLRGNSLKKLLKEISQSINLSESDYQKEIDSIRKESWEEYKKGLF